MCNLAHFPRGKKVHRFPHNQKIYFTDLIAFLGSFGLSSPVKVRHTPWLAFFQAYFLLWYRPYRGMAFDEL